MSQIFELDQTSSKSVVLKLITNICNTEEIRTNLKNGALNCCVLTPELIYDPFQVVVAANKAVTAEKLTTKSLHSEILYNLSYSKNITQSFQKFGLAENGRNALVAVVVQNGDIEAAERTMEGVKGDVADLTELRSLCDIAAVKKAYKLGESKDVLGTIVSKVAAKDVIL